MFWREGEGGPRRSGFDVLCVTEPEAEVKAAGSSGSLNIPNQSVVKR